MSTRSFTRRAGVLVAAGTLAVLSSCGGDDTSEADETAVEAEDSGSATADESTDAVAFGLVTPGQAAELATDPSVTVIDVRTPEEFDSGHIDGATMIDFYEPSFADEIAALDPDQTYLLYCRSGNRSGQAYQLMADLGFEQVYDLDGGMNAYAADGLPLAD